MINQIDIYGLGDTSTEEAEKFADVCTEVAGMAGYDFEYEIVSGVIPHCDEDAGEIVGFVWEHIDWFSDDWSKNTKLRDPETIRWYAGIDDED